MEKVVDLIEELIYFNENKSQGTAAILNWEIVLFSQLFPSNPSGHVQEYVSSPVTVQVPPFWQGLLVHEFT